jgi:hypothetical protein
MAAQFYTGRALKLLEKTILIRGDGSADVYCRSHFKCYRTTQNNFETKQPATVRSVNLELPSIFWSGQLNVVTQRNHWRKWEML